MLFGYLQCFQLETGNWHVNDSLEGVWRQHPLGRNEARRTAKPSQNRLGESNTHAPRTVRSFHTPESCSALIYFKHAAVVFIC